MDIIAQYVYIHIHDIHTLANKQRFTILFTFNFFTQIFFQCFLPYLPIFVYQVLTVSTIIVKHILLKTRDTYKPKDLLNKQYLYFMCGTAEYKLTNVALSVAP